MYIHIYRVILLHKNNKTSYITSHYHIDTMAQTTDQKTETQTKLDKPGRTKVYIIMSWICAVCLQNTQLQKKKKYK